MCAVMVVVGWGAGSYGKPKAVQGFLGASYSVVWGTNNARSRVTGEGAGVSRDPLFAETAPHNLSNLYSFSFCEA